MTIQTFLPAILTCFLTVVAAQAMAQSLGDVARAEREKKASASPSDVTQKKTFSNLEDPPKTPPPAPSSASSSNGSPAGNLLAPVSQTSHTPSTAEIRQQCHALSSPKNELERKQAEICQLMDMPVDSSYESLLARGVQLKNELCSKKVVPGQPSSDPELAAKSREFLDVYRAFSAVLSQAEAELTQSSSDLNQLNNKKYAEVAAAIPGYPNIGRKLTADESAKIRAISASYASRNAPLEEKRLKAKLLANRWLLDLGLMASGCGQ